MPDSIQDVLTPEGWDMLVQESLDDMFEEYKMLFLRTVNSWYRCSIGYWS
jgi:hypothetical protein